jgi:hypothetical protein
MNIRVFASNSAEDPKIAARRLRQRPRPPETAPEPRSARSGEPNHASGDGTQRNNLVISVPAPDSLQCCPRRSLRRVGCRAQPLIPACSGGLGADAKINMALTNIQGDLQNTAGTPNSINNCR